MLADYILFVSVQSKSGRGPRKHFDERLQLDKETGIRDVRSGKTFTSKTVNYDAVQRSIGG